MAFGSTLAFVALDEGRWVGIATALAHAPDQPGPAIVGMFVDPALRGRGGWVREHGGRQLYLWATSTNTPAIRAYARCGFIPPATAGRSPTRRRCRRSACSVTSRAR